MSTNHPIPSPATITHEQIKSCLSVYKDVVKKHYETKIKDPKKAAAAIKRDAWRYEELPSSVNDKGFSLPQLEELVQWKITHGQSRPFLPSMIRKNDPKAVVKQTLSGAKLLPNRLPGASKSQSLESTLEGMKTLEALTGVGPATSSLIASVYGPKEVPFFEDELFQWMCLDSGAADGKVKLKYDKKEYTRLLGAVWDLRERLGHDKVHCVDLEKTAFVLIHVDYVDLSSEDIVEAFSSTRPSCSIEQSMKDGDSQDESARERTNVKKSGKELLKKGSKRHLSCEESTKDSANANGTARRSKRTKT